MLKVPSQKISRQILCDGWTTVASDLTVWQTACYSTIPDVQYHNTCLQIISLLATLIFPSSLFHSPISALLFCSSLELEWIACHSNNPPSLLLPISSLLWRRTSLNKRLSYPSCLFPFSPSIHGSFHPFNGLDSSVSVIANLIFPSLKTWSISLLGSVWQTWKRQN